MPASIIGRELLASYEGLHISEICTAVRFVDDKQNHCAHFVNHVLGWDATLSCGQLLGRPGAAANIRVHETFARCPVVGAFSDRPPDAPCLAFLTLETAVDLPRHRMQNIPKKHIGIFCEGEIWHYSNAQRKVVREAPDKFLTHFGGPGFALYFGTFPEGARALTIPTAPPASSALGKLPELRRERKDDVDVAVWQQFLVIRQLLSGPDIRSLVDGHFGAKTEEATEAFQASTSLEPTGVVDAATYAAAVEQGFVPRQLATPRRAVERVPSALGKAALAALSRMGSKNFFYAEEVIESEGQTLIARLEPHKHSEGTQLRFWHRGITVYPFREGEDHGTVSADVTRGHPGMDTSIYPGDAVMAHLKATTNLKWTGFYLGRAPSHSDRSWMSRRAALVAQGWGLAPIYVGQQERGPGSHDVSGPQGIVDGDEAVALMKQAEFSSGALVYLDIEAGGPLSSAMMQYLQRWCERVKAGGFGVGAYLSHTSVASARQVVPELALWVFRLKSADANVEKQPPFRDDAPSQSGIADAVAWQWAQNCRIPKDSGTQLVDLNVGATADPSTA